MKDEWHLQLALIPPAFIFSPYNVSWKTQWGRSWSVEQRSRGPCQWSSVPLQHKTPLLTSCYYLRLDECLPPIRRVLFRFTRRGSTVNSPVHLPNQRSSGLRPL